MDEGDEVASLYARRLADRPRQIAELTMRGRVVALRLAIVQGCVPQAVGAASGFIAAALALWYLRRGRR
jgi:hypothetical protein